MPIPRSDADWSPETPLAPDVQVALGFLDEIVNGSEATAEIDGDGALRAFIQMDGVLGLYIDIGDSCGSVHYIGGPSRTPYRWRWDSQTTPRQLRALLDGRAVERVRLLGRRRVTATLVVEGRTVDRFGRHWRPLTALLRLPEHERPIEPYVAPAYGDEVVTYAALGEDWIVVLRRNLSDRPIVWYLQYWNHDLSELRTEERYDMDGKAVAQAMYRHGELQWECGAVAR